MRTTTETFELMDGLAVTGLLVWCLLLASYDLCRRILPNWLTLGAHIVAITTLAMTAGGVTGASVSSCLLAWLLAIVLTLPAYLFKWLGAGDVKMLAAIGLLTGLNLMLMSFVVAGLLAALVIIGGHMWQSVVPWLNLKMQQFDIRMPLTVSRSGRVIPFGALLAGGLITALVMLQLRILAV